MLRLHCCADAVAEDGLNSSFTTHDDVPDDAAASARSTSTPTALPSVLRSPLSKRSGSTSKFTYPLAPDEVSAHVFAVHPEVSIDSVLSLSTDGQTTDSDAASGPLKPQIVPLYSNFSDRSTVETLSTPLPSEQTGTSVASGGPVSSPPEFLPIVIPALLNGAVFATAMTRRRTWGVPDGTSANLASYVKSRVSTPSASPLRTSRSLGAASARPFPSAASSCTLLCRVDVGRVQAPHVACACVFVVACRYCVTRCGACVPFAASASVAAQGHSIVCMPPLPRHHAAVLDGTGWREEVGVVEPEPYDHVYKCPVSAPTTALCNSPRGNCECDIKRHD